MRYSNRLTLVSLSILLLSACNGGLSPVPQEPAVFFVYGGKAVLHVAARSGSAEPGTTVRVTSGGSGSDMASIGGSVTFVGTWDGGPVTIEYVKNGQVLDAVVTPLPFGALVTKPFFTTGSAPNDILNVPSDGIGRLLVANSLDNTVTAYTMQGQLIGTGTFPQFASPSYFTETQLGTTGKVAVVRNGDNVVSGFDIIGFSPDSTIEEPLTLEPAAFMGPGKPASDGRFVFVPRAQILSFDPTTYGPGLVSVVDTLGIFPERTVETSGRNALCAAVMPPTLSGDRRGPWHLYLVSAGELQFDENFQPRVDTDSFVDEFAIGDDGSLTPTRSLNLGPIGASVIVLHHKAIGADRQSIAYLGNLLSGAVYKVDLDSFTILRGEDNPIHLTDEFTYVADLALTSRFTDGLLLATSFNTDELYVIDTATDIVSPTAYYEPFDLALDPELLAGASALAIGGIPNGRQEVFVLYALANAAARVELLLEP